MEITIDQALHQGAAALKEGKVQVAERLYRAILQAQPNHPDANHNLGVLNVSVGKPLDALPLFKLALEAGPKVEQFWLSYAEVLIRLERLDEAKSFLAEASKSGVSSEKLDALNQQLQVNLPKDASKAAKGQTLSEKRKRSDEKKKGKKRKAGGASSARGPSQDQVKRLIEHQQAGRFAEAEALAVSFTQQFPKHPLGWTLLSVVFAQTGRLRASLAPMQKVVELSAQDAKAHNNLGVTFKGLGRLDEAETCYRRAIALRPHYAEAHYNLGSALKELGRLEEAEASYKQAIVVISDFTEAWSNLGAVQQGLGRLDEAEISHRKAIVSKPDYAEAHYNLGLTLAGLGRLEDGEASYRRSIALSPDFARAHYNLGLLLERVGKIEQARSAFTRASALEPSSINYWCLANFYFSPVHNQAADIEREREAYSNALSRLKTVSVEPRECKFPISTRSFDLAYHNCEDTNTLLSQLQSTLRQAPFSQGLIYRAAETPHVKKTMERLVVGICSSFLAFHTIGFLYQGLIQVLASKSLHIVLLIPSDAKRDSMRKLIERDASEIISLSNEPLIAARQIDEANLDFLFYPDIGMSPMTYQLALSRLAPVQATSWGHPITTGLDTMDYFISSELLEPADAQIHYSEQLVLLSNLPSVYRLPELTSTAKDCRSLNLPRDRLLIGIPQSLFKFHPDFDQLLEAIVLELPDARLILVRDKSDLVTDKLKKRWRQYVPQVLEQAIFLPRMAREDFLKMLDKMDFLLDPIYFGSGNTFYEAMMFGTPVVTLPGKRLAGRVVLGGYRQMCVDNPPVANSNEDYVRLAVQLASDEVALTSLKSVLRGAASRYLFNDTRVGDEFAALISLAVDAATQGRKLPSDWRANIS
jgi:predicted O-linked N-acetylglucosamine transferase (SPINDLY family)